VSRACVFGGHGKTDLPQWFTLRIRKETEAKRNDLQLQKEASTQTAATKVGMKRLNRREEERQWRFN
jgi:hypothetical protein